MSAARRGCVPGRKSFQIVHAVDNWCHSLALRSIQARIRRASAPMAHATLRLPEQSRREPKTTVAGIVDIPSGTEQQYEQVIATAFPEGKHPEG